MQLEVNWWRKAAFRRARRRSPRKTRMMGHFLRRTSDSDWTADCHTQRRISCSSCFRSRTWCNASTHPKGQTAHASYTPNGMTGTSSLRENDRNTFPRPVT